MGLESHSHGSLVPLFPFTGKQGGFNWTEKIPSLHLENVIGWLPVMFILSIYHVPREPTRADINPFPLRGVPKAGSYCCCHNTGEFCVTPHSGSGGVSDCFACPWDPFPLLGCFAQPWYEGLCPVLLYIVIPGRPALLWRKTKGEWLWGRGRVEEGPGRVEGRRNEGQDALNEKRINKKRKKWMKEG